MSNHFSKQGAIIVYGILVCILYLPQFVFLKGFPQILNDSYAYLLMGKDIYEGQLPLGNYYGDLPTGYSIFIALIYKFGGNLQIIIGIQSLIFTLSFIPIIHFFNKRSIKQGFIASILCFFYISTSESLLWSTLLYTESLYISALALFTFGLFSYLESPKKKYAIILVTSILLACLFRSNGIFLFGILLGLILLKIIEKKKKESVFLIYGFVSILVFSSILNLCIKGHVLPLETIRLGEKLGVVEKESPVRIKKKGSENKIDIYSGTFTEQSWKLLINASKCDFGNHYYYRMPLNLMKFFKGGFEEEVRTTPSLDQYKKVDLKYKEDFISFVKKDLTFTRAEELFLFDVTDVEKRPRNFWIYLCHLIHLGSFVFRNSLVVILFWACFVFAFVKAMKSKFDLNYGFTHVFIMGMVHISSIVLLMCIVPRDTSLSRYAITTEFFVLLLPLYLIYKNKLKRLNA